MNLDDAPPNNDEFRIYGLFTVDLEGTQHYFYVGMTERAIQERVNEHRRGTFKRHEDLYKYLKELDRDGINWGWTELRHCAVDHYWKDAERWEVIHLLRLGHDLRNMRYGNATRRAELAQQVGDPEIRSASDVTRLRAAAVRAKIFDRSIRKQRLHQKLLRATITEIGIPNIAECGLLGGALKRRLVTEGFEKVPRGFDFKDLVCMMRQSRRLEEIRKSLPPLPALNTRSDKRTLAT